MVWVNGQAVAHRGKDIDTFSLDLWCAMARPLRVEFEDAIYHLCAQGNARQAIFHDQRDRVRFVPCWVSQRDALSARRASS